MWCCSYEDGEGLWYTDKYPAEAFFASWEALAERYKGSDAMTERYKGSDAMTSSAIL